MKVEANVCFIVEHRYGWTADNERPKVQAQSSSFLCDRWGPEKWEDELQFRGAGEAISDSVDEIDSAASAQTPPYLETQLLRRASKQPAQQVCLVIEFPNRDCNPRSHSVLTKDEKKSVQRKLAAQFLGSVTRSNMEWTWIAAHGRLRDKLFWKRSTTT
ncbi:hypothetical protein MRS44_014746 [Fusarium solani]|uniref:uncharacterized protein n=1 Tax=Fusarium solani TaxID=169388 RepID=UPI0032C3DC83|nr:hypothetical protein MRS44_014746 [Fusarium solani]